MKDHQHLRNLIIALAFFVLWGNVVSLMLPPEAHETVIKLVDFGSLLFALAVLAAGVSGFAKAKRGERKEERSDKDNSD
jgi:hypothetical protein